MNNWKEILAPALSHPKVVALKAFIQDERKKGKNIYPAPGDIFRAFDLCPWHNTKIVIIGQDPYHGPGQADGLAFSSRAALTPPSLQVIFKEIYQDLNIQYFHNITFEEFFPTNNLEKWAKYGFLLLNSTLSVEEGKAGSHVGMGWELVIQAVVESLNKMPHVTLLCLWGKHAQEFEKFVNPNGKVVVMKAAHPAAELYGKDAGFSGCRHFSIMRDIIPTIEGRSLYKELHLDAYFDKKHAIELVKECYPIEQDRLIDYINKDLFIHIPVNKEEYFNEMKKIELVLSTKY